MQAFFNAKCHRMVTAIVIGLIGLAAASYAYSNYQMARTMYPMPMNISVTGEGEVSAIPDVGQFSFSVMADGAEVAAAQEASGAKINDIMAYLKEQGVEEKDIKTENYNLYPKYRYEGGACMGGWCPPGKEIADGFEVSQTVSVKVRDTAKAGALIAGVGDKGATNISGLSFTIDDESKLKEEARSKAIADAKTKAEKIAADLGVEIVRVTSFYESEGYYPSPYGYGGEMMMDAKAESFNGPSTPMGENTTKVQVNLSYEVK
jgi:uncharacterized protein